MRHHRNKQRLSLNRGQRKALIRNLARNLLLKERIITTQARAKVVRGDIDHLINLAKRANLSARRQVAAFLAEKDIVNLLFKEIAPRFRSRTSGFTRLLRLGRRRGDNAQLVLLELVERRPTKAKPERAKDKETKAKEEKPIEKKLPPQEKEVAPAPQKIEEAPKHLPEKEKARPPKEEKKPKKFFGGLKKFFKRERDSL
jgi:large subunit ribosomal protein L17